MAPKNDMQDLMQGWVETQRKIWTDWVETLQEQGGTGAMPTTWEQGLSNWREAVQRTLDTQVQATRNWAEQMAKVDAAPDELKRWASEGVALVEQWSDAQRGIWDQWFDLMAKANPAAAGLPGQDQLGQLAKGWEQAVTQMQEMQRRWASSFAPGAAPPKKK